MRTPLPSMLLPNHPSPTPWALVCATTPKFPRHHRTCVIFPKSASTSTGNCPTCTVGVAVRLRHRRPTWTLTPSPPPRPQPPPSPPPPPPLPPSGMVAPPPAPSGGDGCGACVCLVQPPCRRTCACAGGGARHHRTHLCWRRRLPIPPSNAARRPSVPPVRPSVRTRTWWVGSPNQLFTFANSILAAYRHECWDDPNHQLGGSTRSTDLCTPAQCPKRIVLLEWWASRAAAAATQKHCPRARPLARSLAVCVVMVVMVVVFGPPTPPAAHTVHPQCTHCAQMHTYTKSKTNKKNTLWNGG